MRLLQITHIHPSFARCTSCGWLMNPVVYAVQRGSERSEPFCMRCYHVLSAIQVKPFQVKGGA